MAVVLLACGCASLRERSDAFNSALNGNLVTDLGVRPADVIAVAKDTCDDLRLVIISTTPPSDDDPATRIVARNDDNERVTIAVRADGPSATRVSVGTGMFGNSVLRQRVMDVIKARLEAATDDDRDDTAMADTDE